MNANFKAKFLQHLSSNKADNEGFTLIELLVVIIIIGILAAIALPSFLNQAAKARQAEGKNNVGAVNRSQQSFRLENDAFATDFAALKIGIPTQGNNYTFAMTPTPTATLATVVASALDQQSVRDYVGAVIVIESGDAAGQTAAVSCGEEEPVDGNGVGAVPDAADPAARCTGGVPVE
jgi:type IV pilus assembly protein PilA